MLNKFCFHVYAQKSVFIGQNVNFLTPSTPDPPTLEFIELVPSKKLELDVPDTLGMPS